MKHKVFFLSAFALMLLLASCNSYGQKKDSLKSKWADATRIEYRVQGGDTTWYSEKMVQWGDPITMSTSVIKFYPKYDTINCIMLVCDTTFRKDVIGYVGYFGDTVAYIENRMIHVWWQFGYEVKKMASTSLLAFDERGHLLIDNFEEYLDQNKKPLRKSIVVWMTKEIEQ